MAAGKEPATRVSEAEVSSLNVDFMLALLKVVNSSDAMRVEAGRCGCYRIVNTVLVYLLRFALQHGDVAITPLGELAPLTLRVPLHYQLLPKGVTSVTPLLFRRRSPRWRRSGRWRRRRRRWSCAACWRAPWTC